MDRYETNLVDRIEKLERENRRLRRVGGSLLTATAAIGLMSLAAPALCKTVWGERFVLKDGGGRERMVLDAYGSAAPSLVFKDRKGRPLARLDVGDDALDLQVFREGEPTAAGFRLEPEEGAAEPARRSSEKSVN